MRLAFIFFALLIPISCSKTNSPSLGSDSSKPLTFKYLGWNLHVKDTTDCLALSQGINQASRIIDNLPEVTEGTVWSEVEQTIDEHINNETDISVRVKMQDQARKLFVSVVEKEVQIDLIDLADVLENFFFEFPKLRDELVEMAKFHYPNYHISKTFQEIIRADIVFDIAMQSLKTEGKKVNFENLKLFDLFISFLENTEKYKCLCQLTTTEANARSSCTSLLTETLL